MTLYAVLYTFLCLNVLRGAYIIKKKIKAEKLFLNVNNKINAKYFCSAVSMGTLSSVKDV